MNKKGKQDMWNRWKKSVSGVALGDSWPKGKWKGKASVQWVIENDFKYVEYMIGINAILLDNEAYSFYIDIEKYGSY